MCNRIMSNLLAYLSILLLVNIAIAQSDLAFQCPYCDALEYGVFRHGETWTEKDPCVKFLCNHGAALKEDVSCEELSCENGTKIMIPGQCCPQCESAMETIIITWSPWSEWGSCSEECDTGRRVRTRSCDSDKSKDSMDVIFDCVGHSLDEEPCNTHPCAVNGSWSEWSPYGTCSQSCGEGVEFRFRTCTNPPPQHGGSDCEGEAVDSRPCNTYQCPIDGVWTEWSVWDDCSKSCGNGTHTRTRTCVPPKFGGADCEGVDTETGVCNSHHCPIDGVWSDWSEWSECPVTCGGGIQVQSRVCTPPQYNGKWCEGHSLENRTCNSRRCPVDGYWKPWSDWSTCSASCAGGIRSRSRRCTRPKFGGKQCQGDDFETEECNTQNCPVDGVWTEWSEWSECSVTCGGGVRSQTRNCTPPMYGGKQCEGSSIIQETCNPDSCIDACRPNPCYHGVTCLNDPNSLHLHRCDPCPVGMTGNGTHCEPVNECQLANPCADGVECIDLKLGWKCGKCPDGYNGARIRGNDLVSASTTTQVCTDINECQKRKYPCHDDADCTNTIGGYSCTCKQYYRGDGKNCTVDNACQLGLHNCDSDDWCVNRGNGEFSCECPIGFEGNGIVCLPDSDLDGIVDEKDNCPDTPNGGQENADDDMDGDACDNDADNDEIQDENDNCKFIKNIDQKDTDNDGIGNECDNCPTTQNPDQKDSDNDGEGDFCDRDIDNDGLIASWDNCPFDYNPDQTDTDSKFGAGDGAGDACDNCVHVRNSDQRDKDEDTIGDACDTDIDEDNDGVQDGRPDGGVRFFDNCRSLANADQLDTDGDGSGDACDNDDDDDGIKDHVDNCPKVYNPLQQDTNVDGTGDACENDFDADGIVDTEDACPYNKEIKIANFNSYKTVKLSNNQAARTEKHAQWKVTGNGSEITQLVDNQPEILIGEDSFMDLDFNGTFFVNDDEDDDYAGFVFNYQSNKRFMVVVWKKQNEIYSERSPFVSRALSGIQIKVVDSQSGPGTMLRNALWKSRDTRNEVKTIWHDSNLVGWEYKKAYRWNLKYSSDNGCMRLKFFSGSTQIVDSGCVCDTTITGGKLGVFSFSQANVIWSNMKYSCLTDNKCETPLGRTSRR